MKTTVYFTFPETSSLADAYIAIPCYSTNYPEWKMSTVYPKGFYTMHSALDMMSELELNPKKYPIPFGYMPEDSFQTEDKQ